MVDPVNPGLTLTAEDIKDLNSSMEISIPTLQRLAEGAAKLGKSNELLNEILTKTRVDVERAKEAIGSAADKVVGMSGASSYLTDVFKKLRDGTVDVADSTAIWDSGLAVSTTLLFSLNDGLDQAIGKLGMFGSFGAKTSDAFKLLTADFKDQIKIIPGLGQVFAGIEKLKPFADRAAQANLMENAFLGVTAAAGDLSDTFRSTLGPNFDNLDDKMNQFHQMMTDVATNTGLSKNQAMEYGMQLKQIPGALQMMVTSASSSAGAINNLDAIIRVSRGTHQDAGKVIDTLGEIYKNLGTKGEGALSVISRMYEVSNRIKMPADVMKSYVLDAANSFKLLGDNTQGAMDIMSKMGGALASSGLGPTAVKEIVSGFVSGIDKLSIAQKSFMSARAGGAGGLRGGFEMDMMFKEGNLAGVAAKVESAMKSMFGGKIVDLKEASQSERAASQMLKQVELLKSFGMASSDKQAYGLLEAFKGGGTTGMSKEQALEKAINEGNTIIDRQKPVWNDMLNSLTLQNDADTIKIGYLMRLAGFQGGETNRKDTEARELAAGKNIMTGSGINTKEVLANSGKQILESGDRLAGIATKGYDFLMGQLTSLKQPVETRSNEAFSALKSPTKKEPDFISAMRNRTYGESGEVMPAGVTLPPKAAPEVRGTIEAAEMRKEAAERYRAPERMSGMGASGRPTESHVFITAKFGEEQDFEIITNEVGSRIKRRTIGESITGVTGSGK